MSKKKKIPSYEAVIDLRPFDMKPPLLNYRGPDDVIVVRDAYSCEAAPMAQRDMTKAEYAAKSKDYKGTRVSADGSHRVRTAMIGDSGGRGTGVTLVLVYLTDSKDHGRPS